MYPVAEHCSRCGGVYPCKACEPDAYAAAARELATRLADLLAALDGYMSPGDEHYNGAVPLNPYTVWFRSALADLVADTRGGLFLGPRCFPDSPTAQRQAGAAPEQRS